MPYYMYVSLQDDDKIAVFTMDAGTGKISILRQSRRFYDCWPLKGA